MQSVYKVAGIMIALGGLLGMLLVVIGMIRHNRRSSTHYNELMRSFYYIPAVVLSYGFIVRLVRIQFPELWAPKLVTEYATSVAIVQVVAYTLFHISCRKAIKRESQDVDATDTQIWGMMKAQVGAIVVLLGFEVVKLAIVGQVNYWYPSLYLLSFLYGVAVTLWWRWRA